MGCEEEIRQIAYQLWEQEGCPEGREVEHWKQAEAIWQDRQQAAASTQPERPRRATRRGGGRRRAAKPAEQ